MLTLAYCRGEPARIQLAQRLLIRDQAGAWRVDRGEKRRAPAVGPTEARGAYVQRLSVQRLCPLFRGTARNGHADR